MKRTLLRIAGIVLISVLLCVLTVNCSIPNHDKNPSGLICYSLNKQDCESLFGVAPDQFKSAYFHFYNEYGDLRLNSYVDKNGNLIIRLNRKQYDSIYNHYIDCVKMANDAGIYISEDFNVMTVKGYREDIWSILLSHGLIASTGMIGIQNLTNGYGNWSVVLRLVDEVSGEVVFEKTFQDVFQFSKEMVSNLTPRPQESTSDSTEIIETTTQNP